MNMQRGFTLIEILITAVIMGGLTIVLSQSFAGITRGSMKSELIRDIKQSGDFSVQLMEQMIRSAVQVTSACTPAGVTSTSLRILGTDGIETTFRCTDTTPAGVTRIASVSALGTQYLTPENVTLGGSITQNRCVDPGMSLQFRCVSFPSQPSSVTISYTLSQKGQPVNAVDRAQTYFKTTVNVRNSN